MKILWYTSTSCGAEERMTKSQVSGSWQASLLHTLSKVQNIEMHVCYLSNSCAEDFSFEGVFFHPIYNKGFSTPWRILLSRYKSFLSLFLHRCSYDFLTSFEQVARRIKPDVIHLHGTESEYALLTTCEGLAPTVISIQGLVNPIWEKYYAGIPSAIVKKYTSIIDCMTLATVGMTRRAWKNHCDNEIIALRHSRFLIGRTDWDRDICKFLAPNAEYFTGNEVMRDSFYRYRWGKDFFGKPFTIVSTISNGPYKGIETIAKTARLLKSHGFCFHWIVIGTVETDRYPAIISKWLSFDYRQYGVELVGRKSEKEVCDLLLEADLFCSVGHIENSSNSVCEAMLLGMPVISSYVGGASSLIENDDTGLLFQEGDSYGLAAKIKSLASNIEKAKELAANAYNIAHRRHQKEIVCEQYVSIYHSIAAYSGS